MAYDKIRLNRTEFRLQPSAVQAQQAPKINELENVLTQNGVSVTAWDYPTGTVIMNAGTTDADSNAFELTTDYVRYWMLIRVVTTVGATPAATYAIQGSNDDSTYANAYYADKATLTTFVNTTFDLTSATTAIKLVKLGQEYRYWRVSVSAVTNVTSTIDVTYFGTK